MFDFFNTGQKYVCIFCGERKRADTARTRDGSTGLCRSCAEKLLRMPFSQPYQGTRNVDYMLAPFGYAGGLKKAIIDFKFHNCRSYSTLLARISREYLDSYEIWEAFDMITAVPLHKDRLRERGYNQSELLGVHFSEYLGIPMRADLLCRIRATKKQSTLGIREKAQNVKGAFKCEKPLCGADILLFDDICTTGSTLEACASALKSGGAGKICALTLAAGVKKEMPIITY